MNRKSFHDTTIRASVTELISILGRPYNQSNDGQEKVNFEWDCKTKDDEFTIYDWKEYRTISEDEQIEWHIGGYSKVQTDTIANMLELDLNKLRLLDNRQEYSSNLAALMNDPRWLLLDDEEKKDVKDVFLRACKHCRRYSLKTRVDLGFSVIERLFK